MAASRRRVRAIVVGSGPVGAAAARRLAERGCATTLLEAGVPVPLEERPDAPPGSHLRNQERFRRAPESFLAAALACCTFYDAAAPREALPGACETIAVGGQGLLWTNNCPRTEPGLERWPALDDAGWERRYADAERVLHVAREPLAASVRGQRIGARLAEHLSATSPAGRSVRALPLAGWLRSDGTHWVASADVLADVDADAPLELRPATRAVAIEHDGRRVRGVRIEHAGRTEDLATDLVLVAAGAFATPRLLAASGIRPPALGRFLHYHPLLLGQIVLDPALAAPSDDDPAPRLYVPPTAAAPWHGMVLRDVGAGAPREEIPERRLVELQFFAPLEPREVNHMTLDGERPRFSVAFAERDRAVLDAMAADVRAVAAALGRWRRGAEPDWNPHGFSHPMGTTRMGEDPARSVADLTGRVHGFDNLYLAGPGLIPVAIAVNPTLTAVALALETAERAAET
jgi:choline dehydrogenase-like flavoprotein